MCAIVLLINGGLTYQWPVTSLGDCVIPARNNNNMILPGDRWFYCPMQMPVGRDGVKRCWHLWRAIKQPNAQKNCVITIIVTFPHANVYLFFVYNYNISLHVYAETNHCVLSWRTLILGMCRCHTGVHPHRSHLHLYLVGPAACVHWCTPG